MANFDLTTGVLDSWDLLYPVLERYVDRNKESVQVGNLKLFSSPSSLFLKKTSFTPVFNSISAGYYPVLGGLYKSHPSAHNKPLIQVTVCPKSAIPVTNAHKRPKRPKKKTLDKSQHSINTNKTFIAIPSHKKEKLYVIETTDADIYKEINDNKLLSECMINSYLKDMNKSRKKSPDKVKEKFLLKTIPECSPNCAYMNNTNKTKNVLQDRSGPPSPQSPGRSNYATGTKVETMIKKQTTINKQATTSQKHMSKLPDRNSLIMTDDGKTKSPIRTNQQKTKISIYQSEKSQNEESLKSPDRNSMRSKRSIESIIAEARRRSPERYDKIGRDTGRPDRIRITGRLGLTEDDKCVLKCDATLNDLPIPTQFQGVNCALLPPCYQACNEKYRSTRMQRDAKVQAKESPIGSSSFSPAATGKESQGTQVDFQMIFSTATNKKESYGRGKVQKQCACINTVDNNSLYDKKDETGATIKKNNNPLIVISVYSKNVDSNEKSGDMKSKQTKSTDKKDTKKIGRSRSPSPAKNKKIGEKKSESRVNESTSKKTVRETVRKVTKSKLSQTQSRSMVRSTSAKTKNETKAKSKTKAQKTPPQSRRSYSPQIKPDEANITEQMKRALIEDFTKNYTEHINQKNAHIDIPLLTKHNVSNITIDIEGDSEYYNVKLQQNTGKVNTELTVRKPPRSSRAGEVTATTLGETDTTSLENFLYVPGNEHRKRSFSQTLMYDGTDLTMNNESDDANALNVKDSIEVSHRRETKASFNNYHERNDIPNDVDTKYLAQLKHYQGDDCPISNPVTRDKEIQKLLGVDKGVKSKTKSSKLSESIEERSEVRSINENYSNNIIIIEPTEINKHWTAASLNEVVNTVILHQMAWNNNIQLLYHSSPRKPKPIVLTRGQYNKVKRTICNRLIAKHTSHITRCDSSYRRLYGHKLKINATNIATNILHYDKDCQTENVHIKQIYAKKPYEHKDTISKTIVADFSNKGSENSSNLFDNSSNDNSAQRGKNVNNYYTHGVKEIFMARDHSKLNYGQIKEDLMKVASVKDVQYRNMSIKKPKVRFSSSDSANYISRSDAVKQDSYSIHTLFKCHQKSVTPNLGTSANSLCNSNENGDSRLKFFEESMPDVRAKKPLLKRLISCLVFKLSPVSQTKNSRYMVQDGSPASSFDTYHISSSLGAMEMSSSLYDTSASFYSDHVMQDVKNKRGFLSSVRSMLTRRNC